MAESTKNTKPLTKKYIDHNPYNCLGILWSDSKKLRLKKTTELKRYLEVSQVPDDFSPIYKGQSFIPLLEIGEEGIESMEQILTNDQDRLTSSLFAFGSLDDVVDPVALEVLKNEKNTALNRELVTLWSDRIKSSSNESVQIFSAAMNLSAYYFNLGESYWTDGLEIKSKALEGSTINNLYKYIDLDPQRYPREKVIDLLSEVLYEKLQNLTMQSQTSILMMLETRAGICVVGFMRFAAKRKENELKSFIVSTDKYLSESSGFLLDIQRYIKEYIEQFNLLRFMPIDKIKLSQLAKEAKESIRQPLIKNWNSLPFTSISSDYITVCIEVTTMLLSLPLGTSDRDSVLADIQFFKKELHNREALELAAGRIKAQESSGGCLWIFLVGLIALHFLGRYL